MNKDLLMVHQFLMALLPRGWRSVRMVVDVTPEGEGRVAKIEVDLKPSGPSAPTPDLGMSQFTLMAGLNQALTRLRNSLVPGWQGGNIKVAIDDEGAMSLEFEGERGLTNVRLAAEDIQGMMLTPQFFAALEAARSFPVERQPLFEAKVRGFKRWSYDQSVAELTWTMPDGSTLRARGQLLASWSRSQQSWLWSWANESVQSSARRLAEELRDRPGAVAAFRIPTFGCALQLATLIANLAAYEAGAVGLFRGPYQDGEVFLAVLCEPQP